ncbi:hypothetical protein D9M68_724830 [compost metagenome]
MRVHRDAGGAAVAGAGVGQRRQHLERTQRAILQHIGGHGVVQLIDDVEPAAGRVEDCVARTGAFTRDGRARRRGADAVRVQREQEHAVQALVRHHDVAAGRIDQVVMRLGERLFLAVRPGLAVQAHRLRHGIERAVGGHGQHGQRAGQVVRHHQVAARGAQRQVHGIASFASLRAPRNEGPVAHVAAQRADVVAVAMHRVQDGQGGMWQQVGRIEQAAHHLRQGERAGVGGVVENADAVAAGIAFARGARADIDMHGASLFRWEWNRPCAAS